MPGGAALQVFTIFAKSVAPIRQTSARNGIVPAYYFWRMRFLLIIVCVLAAGTGAAVAQTSFAMHRSLSIARVGVSMVAPDTGFAVSRYFNGIIQTSADSLPLRISIEPFPLLPYSLVATDLKRPNQARYQVWLWDSSSQAANMVIVKNIGPANKVSGLSGYFSADTSTLVKWMALYELNNTVYVANCSYAPTADQQWDAAIKKSFASVQTIEQVDVVNTQLPFDLLSPPPIYRVEPYAEHGAAYVFKNKKGQPTSEWTLKVIAGNGLKSPLATKEEVLASSLPLLGHGAFNSPYGSGWEYYYEADIKGVRTLQYYGVVPGPYDYVFSVFGEATDNFDAATSVFKQMSRAIQPQPY